MKELEEVIKPITVTQDNALIAASYTMSLNEKRLLCSAIAKLDPTSKAWLAGKAEVTITAKEWSETFGLTGKETYARLNEASAKLFDREVLVYGDSRKGKKIRWISGREYDEGSGKVTLTFSGDVLYYLSGMIDRFTQYELLSVSGLRSVHSVRMYELACQYKDTGWRHLGLDELRHILCLDNQYPAWKDLRVRVIDRACQEITQHTNLDLTYEPIRKGRGVSAIKLKVKKKEQMELMFG